MTSLNSLVAGESDSYDVLSQILTLNKVVSRVTFFTPTLAPMLSERAELLEPEGEVVREALLVKKHMPLPFWDAVFATAMRMEVPVPGILRAALYHNAGTEGVKGVLTLGMSASQLRELEMPIDCSKILAISSMVDCCDGIVRHIPQIDFHCPDTLYGRDLVMGSLAELGLSGYLLASGKSFHFYGVELLSDVGFNRFLGRLLLLSPIVDRAWVAHQLIEGKSALRLSSRPGYGGRPTLIGTIGLEKY